MKRACRVQCKSCPFRHDSVPGWLGGYTAESIPPTLWRNIPFFCHPKIDYESNGWRKRAMKNGKLCIGALVMAGKMMAKAEVGRYPGEEDEEVIEARKGLVEAQIAKVDCLSVQDFVKWHDPKKTTEHMKLLSARKAALTAGQPIPPL